MKLFIAVRWGNHLASDGPDGEDTHFLIRAKDWQTAAELADRALSMLPTECVNSHRKVEPLCHRVLEVGIEIDSSTSIEPDIIMGPWFAYGYRVNDPGYPTHKREYLTDYQWVAVVDDA